MKHSLVVLAGSLGFIATAALARADDLPVTIFMEPEAGFLLTMPGTDAVTAIVDASAGIGQATIEATQILRGNSIVVEGGESSVEFAGSGNALTGVLSINQEAGNMNQQANIRSIVMVDAGGGLGALSLDVNMTQELTGNSLFLHDTGPRSVSITDSFNGGTGIVGINQSAGNMNQQLTAVVVGIGVNVGPDTVQLGDAQLGQIGTEADNTLVDDGVKGPRTNALTNSFNDFHGVAQISQTTGDMNRVSQSVGISITTPGAP